MLIWLHYFYITISVVVVVVINMCVFTIIEERRLTVAELSNQKDIMQQVGGWKLQLCSQQVENLVSLQNPVIPWPPDILLARVQH